MSENSKLIIQNPKFERSERAAWWLVTRRHRPEWQSLVATGVATFSGRPRAHFQAARPGDPVLLYLARPDHAIRAVAVVSQGSGVAGTLGGEGRPEPPADAPNPPKSKIQNPKSLEVQLAFEIPGGL